jgi:energy-coupling factor transporter ATP-binding protein EcfA2
MTDNARIDVADVSVFFPLYHGSSRSLKKTVVAAASGRLGQDRQSRVVVEALRNITFSLGSGDRLGLIGMNGAGKTTLLRTLAGIYEPVMGRVRVQGVLSTMLDTGLGMNVELTGRENIQLRGLYSGLNRAELPRLEDDVAAFSELGDFMDLPMRGRVHQCIAPCLRGGQARVQLHQAARGDVVRMVAQRQIRQCRCGVIRFLDEGSAHWNSPALDWDQRIF